MSKLTRNPKQYYDNYTEITSQIDAAVTCVSEQKALKIGETVSSSTSKLSSVSASGDEAVAELVELVQKIGTQFNTLSTLANQYGSEVEPLYEKLQTQLKDMQKQEESYKKECNNGPDNQNDKYYKTENNEKKFQKALYDADVTIWKDKLDKYEIILQNMCNNVDTIVSQLSSVGSASVSDVAANGLSLTIPNIIPFINDDMIANMQIEDYPASDGQIVDNQNGNNSAEDKTKRTPGTFIEDTENKYIKGYIISSIDGKKHTIFDNRVLNDSGLCNRMAMLAIASGNADDLNDLVSRAQNTSKLGYNKKKNEEFLSPYGLTAETHQSLNKKFENYKQDIKEYLENGNFVMFRFPEGTKKQGRSGQSWNGPDGHWLAALDIRETSSGTEIFIGDSAFRKTYAKKEGQSEADRGWYSIDEFDDMTIQQYTVVSQA